MARPLHSSPETLCAAFVSATFLMIVGTIPAAGSAAAEEHDAMTGVRSEHATIARLITQMEYRMKTRTVARTLALALAMISTLTLRSSAALSEGKDDKSSADSLTEDRSHTGDAEGQGNALVGVWEENASAEVDCQTRQPLGPIIRVLYTFNQGGTMYVEDTFPLVGPYRTTGGGVWVRMSARHYTYGDVHYEFDPDRTFTNSIKQRSDLTLSRDGNSFTEDGTFQGIDPSGSVNFEGCFAGTATRAQF
jgi:hypothetical protein